MNEQIDEILDTFGHAAANGVKRAGSDFKEAKAKLQRLIVEARIEELDKLPRTGWISNGIRYDAILFTQIDNRKLELMELKDKQEDK